MPPNTWTPEKIALLKELYPNSHKGDIIAAISGSWGNIRKKANSLGLIRNPQAINKDRLKRKPRKDGLQPHEIILLKEIYENNSKEDILKQINRSWHLICKNARRLGLKRNPDFINEDRKKRGPRKDSYSQRELDLIKNIYENNTKEFILNQFKINGFDRSWQSIRHTADLLGIKRNKNIVKQEMIDGGYKAPCPPCETLWTEDENECLRNIYPNKSQQYVLSQLPGRTWRAIREHALRVGLSRSKEIIDKDRKKHLKENLGINSTWQLETVKDKSRQTNLQRRGVEYPTQSAEVQEKVKETVQDRYGVDNVFQSEEIKQKIERTNIERYGTPFPNQNEKIREKSYNTAKLNNSFSTSDEEDDFYGYLSLYDPHTEHHVLHPLVRHVIDYFMPRYNLWVQYDGTYWHGKEQRENDTTPRAEKIKINIRNDEIQNKNIPNLIRFWSDDVKEAIQKGTILNLIRNKINEKRSKISASHQYIKKLQHIKNDIEKLPFDSSFLEASSFKLDPEKYTSEIAEFIKKYEWLGSVGVIPRWCFTARYTGLLGGVVLINEPTGYSKILGPDTMKYEALIQRGATVSWAPINLGSRLIMFACRWMVQNTGKRLFIGYGDPKALERGTIYQACNFEYLGNNFGSSYLYRHPLINNNKTFSAQTLKRTSYFRRWCRKQGITTPKTWFKNRSKDTKAIPEAIKNQWYAWNKEILSEAQRLVTERKHKYVLLLGKNKRDQRQLNLLKKYKTKPYPRRNDEFILDCTEDPNFNIITPRISIKPSSTVSTTSRKTPEKLQYIIDNYKNQTKKELAESLKETERWISSQIKVLQREGKLITKNPVGSTKNRKNDNKIQFIIDNHHKLTRQKMADILEETPRWIKRTISALTKKGLIKPKIKLPDKPIQESDWSESCKSRLFELRHKYLKTNIEICDILKKEFNFIINPPALQFWTKRFNCKGWTKQKWLDNYLSADIIKELRAQRYRITDISKYIEKKYGIYISNDLISLHIRKVAPQSN